jgi:hypothetical protein
MSDTPRTDAAWKPDGGDGYPTVDVDVARQLERELNVAKERIKNLESALCTVENIDKVNAYQDLESANERITQLERENDALRADLLLWREQEVKA